MDVAKAKTKILSAISEACKQHLAESKLLTIADVSKAIKQHFPESYREHLNFHCDLEADEVLVQPRDLFTALALFLGARYTWTSIKTYTVADHECFFDAKMNVIYMFNPKDCTLQVEDLRA